MEGKLADAENVDPGIAVQISFEMSHEGAPHITDIMQHGRGRQFEFVTLFLAVNNLSIHTDTSAIGHETGRRLFLQDCCTFSDDELLFGAIDHTRLLKNTGGERMTSGFHEFLFLSVPVR